MLIVLGMVVRVEAIMVAIVSRFLLDLSGSIIFKHLTLIVIFVLLTIMIKFIHLVPVLVVLSPVVQQEHICKIVLVYNAQTIIIVQDPFMPLHVQQIIEVKEDQDI